MDEKFERRWRFLKVYSLVWLITMASSLFLMKFFYIKSELAGVFWLGCSYLSSPVSVLFFMFLQDAYKKLRIRREKEYKNDGSFVKERYSVKQKLLLNLFEELKKYQGNINYIPRELNVLNGILTYMENYYDYIDREMLYKVNVNKDNQIICHHIYSQYIDNVSCRKVDKVEKVLLYDLCENFDFKGNEIVDFLCNERTVSINMDCLNSVILRQIKESLVADIENVSVGADDFYITIRD